MHLIKPSWLVHSDEHRSYEIYSVHVSPDGIRLASGGLDGKIRIWSTLSIYNTAPHSAPSNDPLASKHQLCSMSTHTGAVTVVRFSPCGRYLASGSDDRVVLIWERDDSRPVPATEFGQSSAASPLDPPNSETWVARKRLIGHDNDVQDLAWAPDSSILVTVGLDSSVFIWSGSSFEKLKRFDSHQSHVKGVSFDPANKYFATASDDRSVKIIRYHHDAQSGQVMFSLEATIAAPFRASPLSTYYRRCSWSPDGNHIAAANATNGPVTTVTIINRGTWDSDISLVGHDAPCEVASFCPRIFSLEKIDLDHPPPQDASSDNPTQYTNLITVIATAGQDKTLAIWNTSNPRPLLVARNVAEKSITDIAWSADGSKLFASSLDGSILVAMFDPGELGWTMPLEENAVQLTRYGGGKEALQIPSSTGMLALEEAGEEKKKDSILDTIMGSNPSNTSNSFDTTPPKPAPKPPADDLPKVPKTPAPVLQQKVTITKDGKKRIAPMLISSASSVSTRVSTIKPPATLSNTRAPAGVVDYAPPSNALPHGGISSLLIGSKRRHNVLEESANGADSHAANGASAAAAPQSSTPGAGPGATGSSSAANGHSKGLANGTAGANSHATKKQRPYTEITYIRPPLLSAASAIAQVRLAVPKVRTVFARRSVLDADGSAHDATAKQTDKQGPDQAPTDAVFVLEARNTSAGKGSELVTTAKITVSRESPHPSTTYTPPPAANGPAAATPSTGPIFTDYLPRYAQLAAGAADSFWAVATEDGCIYVYSPHGRRLFPPLVLGAPLAFLESSGPHLLAITAVGLVHVWNVSTRSALLAGLSLAPVLDAGSRCADDGVVRGPKIVRASVSPAGAVALTLSNGDSHLYDAAMKSWTRVADAWWASGSQYWDTTNAEGSLGAAARPVGIVSLLESRSSAELQIGAASPQSGLPGLSSSSTSSAATTAANRARVQLLQRLVRGRMVKDGYEHFERHVSAAHLETRVAAARAAKSDAEYSLYVRMYAQRLAADGDAGKLEELLAELYAPGAAAAPRPALLHDVVIAVGGYRSVQRVVAKYAVAAGVVSDLDGL